MLFDRRTPPKLKEKLRVAIWPRRNWKRSIRYVLTRMSRLRTAPSAIARGAAAGVLVSFTPFLGFHFILAGLLAWTMRGSIIASALGTFFGNPLTFPFIWIGTYQLGNRLLGLETKLQGDGLAGQIKDMTTNITNSSWDSLWPAIEMLWPIMLKPMAVGGVIMGLVAGLVSYYLVKKLVGAYQVRHEVGQPA